MEGRPDERSGLSTAGMGPPPPQSPTPALQVRVNDPAMFVTPQRKIIPASGSGFLDRLKQAAASYKNTPSIFSHTSPEEEDELQKRVDFKIPAWDHVFKGKPAGARRDLKYALRSGVHADALSRQGVQKVSKVSGKSKGLASGRRTFTSRYRGVHQTFPTKRWEAQFRRNGKPTSLGCFDKEEEAARAYDKMMLWCELNSQSPQKAGYGITNFEYSQYEKEIHYLSTISQDALTQALRQDGRNQAAKRAMRQKRDGQLGVTHLTAGFVEHGDEDMEEEEADQDTSEEQQEEPAQHKVEESSSPQD